MTREEAKYLFNEFEKESIDKGINKLFDDFESRTCENCKSFIWDDKYITDYGTCEKGIGITFRGVDEVNKDFGCNKWKQKNG